MLRLVCTDCAAVINQMATRESRNILYVARRCVAKLKATLCRLPAIDSSRILWADPLREYEKDGAWHWLPISWECSTYPSSPLSSDRLRRLRLRIEEERVASWGTHVSSIEVDGRYTVVQSTHYYCG